MLSPQSSAHKNGSDDVNPFRISQHNLLQMMNKDKRRTKQEQQRKFALPVHEKVTLTGRIKARQRLIESNTAGPHTQHQLQDKSAQRIFRIKDPNIDRRSMNEYITKKRELFLMEYSLAVKRGEIQFLEQMAVEEERKLTSAEKFLEDNSILFEDFLKENDNNSVEAIKMAEQETKMKLDKIAEIKKITSKIVSIKSDISKYEDILGEYRNYEEFLLMLSQPERSKSGYFNDMNAKTDGKPVEKTSATSDSKSGENQVVREPSKPSHQSDKIPAPETDSSDNEKDPELLFTDPEELLNVMAELEEQTLSLIQNTRDAEESLDEFRQTAELTKKKIESESQQLKEQMDVMTDTIQRETQRTAQLEQRCKLFGFGKYKPEDQDNTFKSLSDKVEEVYRCCVGETAANLSTLQMLTSIESKLVELLDNADMIPRDRMTVAVRAKEKERRIRLREEKIRLQMIHQEERQKKAMERSKTEKTARKNILTKIS